MLARQKVSLARHRLALAQSLSVEVGRMVSSGETRRPMRRKRAKVASAAMDAVDAEAQASSAEAVLLDLTGIAAIPQLTPGERLPVYHPGREERITGNDPLVSAARQKVGAARAALELVHVADRGDSKIGVEGIRKTQFGSPWDTRFGVVLHIPLPSRARNLPRIANAQSSLTSAETELLRASGLWRLD